MVTRASLDKITERLNEAAGTPLTYWETKDPAHPSTAAIGHYHVESVFPRQFRLVQTVSAKGGTRDVTPARSSARIAELIHVYRQGIEAARPAPMAPVTRAVNFEFPLRLMSEALSYIAGRGLIEPVGLHLHASAQGANDEELQVRASAWTTASDAQWFAFCQVFRQDCVALMEGEQGVTIGPKHWVFDARYFIQPTATQLCLKAERKK